MYCRSNNILDMDMDMEVPWWAIPQEDNKKISKTKQEEVRVTRKTKLPKQ